MALHQHVVPSHAGTGLGKSGDIINAMRSTRPPLRQGPDQGDLPAAIVIYRNLNTPGITAK